jgi:uncharacterized protein YjbI with pentapeptide repeats
MRTIKPTVLGLLTRPFEYQRQFRLGAAVTAFVPMDAPPALLAETGMWPFLAEELPPDQALDAVIPKSHAEFLAVAHAYAPGRQPVTQLRVGLKLGHLAKTLGVFGERYMLGERPTEAKPFTTMPIDWAHAYGGPGFTENPSGLGAQAVDTAAGKVTPIANVVANMPAAGYRSPASFMALDQMWPQRARLAGTYGESWLKEDFPGFPRDIDWGFFNIAPDGQQFSGMLRGDEDYAAENLHPERPLITGQLPGIAPRLFLRRKGDAALEEVGLNLTTVWFFPHRLRLALIFHGHAKLREEDGADIDLALLGADLLDAPRPLSAFEDVLAQRLDPKTKGKLALRDDLLVPAHLAVPDPALDEMKTQLMPQAPTEERRRRRMAREHEKMRAEFAAQGMDPDKHFPSFPEERPLPSEEEIPGFLAQIEAEAAAERAKAEAEMRAQEENLAPIMAKQGLSPDEMRKAREAKPKGPPKISATELRKHLTGMQTELGAHSPDFLNEKLADPETETQWRQAEANARAGYQQIAHFQDAADPRNDEDDARLRTLILSDAAVLREIYDFSGADFSGLNFAGRDLSGICLDGANLAGCDFRGANLTQSVLAHARMQACRFDGADLTGANLGKGQLEAASFRGAMLGKAILSKADLTRAIFAEADLEAADLADVVLDGADFSGARAPGLLMMNTSLRGWHAPGIMLETSKFLDVDFSGAEFSGANLFKVAFVGCTLDGAHFAKARLHKAVFVKESRAAQADFRAADLSGANLRETWLEGADFSQANLAGADLSAAFLAGAKLPRANATGARFTAARMAGADLRHANFLRADLARADLAGADLSEAGLTDANMARVKLDDASHTQGIVTTRMRHLPRYQPPQEVA